MVDEKFSSSCSFRLEKRDESGGKKPFETEDEWAARGKKIW